MKTEREISFDFQNAMKQARRLEALAEQIDRRVAGKLGEATERIHAAWKGDSAACYLGKNQELQGQIRQSAKTLRASAEEVRRIARQMYEAEMRALEIAQQRTS